LRPSPCPRGDHEGKDTARDGGNHLPLLPPADEVFGTEREMRADRRGPGMQEMRATVWIGKQGLTPTVVEELVQQLKKRHRVKVKWLRNTDVDPRELARSAGAVLLEVRGRTAVFTERKSL